MYSGFGGETRHMDTRPETVRAKTHAPLVEGFRGRNPGAGCHAGRGGPLGKQACRSAVSRLGRNGPPWYGGPRC